MGEEGEVKELVKQDWLIDQSGFVYIFTSNESAETDVFFDNLQVTVMPGPLLQETHYYPFGLTMVGISSNSVGKFENKYKANGGVELQKKEFSDGSGLEFYDATFRTYDAQIGRFHQIDPLAEIDEAKSPFSFVSNNPISFADPLGLQDSTAAPGFPNSTTGANVLPGVIVTSGGSSGNTSSNNVPEVSSTSVTHGPGITVSESNIPGVGPLSPLACNCEPPIWSNRERGLSPINWNDVINGVIRWVDDLTATPPVMPITFPAPSPAIPVTIPAPPPPPDETQYRLITLKPGLYPKLSFGNATQFYRNGIVPKWGYLGPGETWKIGTTGGSRYSKTWLTLYGLQRVDEFTGPPQANLFGSNYETCSAFYHEWGITLGQYKTAIKIYEILE